jgi:hypothetical protein
VLNILSRTKRTLRFKLLGDRNELLTEKHILSNGRYVLSKFCEKATLCRVLKLPLQASASGLGLVLTKANFSISVPAGCQVLAEGHSTTAEARLTLSWPQWPSNFTVIFPNKVQAVFEADRLPLKFLWKRFTCFPLLGALLIHSVALGIFAQPAPIRITPLRTEVRLAQNATAPAAAYGTDVAPGTPSTKLAATRKLVDSFGLHGKTKRSNLGPSAKTSFDNAFKRAPTSRNLASWQLDIDRDELHDTSLNLTDAEVKKAFEGISAKLKQCYEDVLIFDSTLKGVPLVRLLINVSGSIEDLDFFYLKSKDESRQALKKCFINAYRSVHFPKKPNRDFEVTHTVVLTY